MVLVLLVFTLLSGCGRKAAPTGEGIPADAAEPVEKHTTPVTTDVLAKEDSLLLPKTEPRLFASLKRSPCYGHCPVYEVQFYSNGQALYLGEHNVPLQGIYLGAVADSVIQQILEKARAIALEAGSLLLEGLGKAHNHDRKSSSVDLVTEYDRRAEELIRSHRLQRPEGAFRVRHQQLAGIRDIPVPVLRDCPDRVRHEVGGVGFAAVGHRGEERRIGLHQQQLRRDLGQSIPDRLGVLERDHPRE